MPWTMVASAARWFSSTRRQSLTYFSLRVGDVGRDLLHGVEAEIAAVGEDRGEQGADLAGVDLLLAGLLEVDVESEIVLDLDEQVGQPDRGTAGVQPAMQLGEAVRLRRVGRLGRVRLEPPPGVVERDRPVLSATPARKRSNASESRSFRRSTAAPGSTGNPVRAQNASRTCSHCAVGRKKASKRPKFFAPSMARLPVWISSRTLRNNALSQRRRSVTPSRRMSGCSRLMRRIR